jgi:hypothetical protein
MESEKDDAKMHELLEKIRAADAETARLQAEIQMLKDIKHVLIELNKVLDELPPQSCAMAARF